ncbi:MAG: hypothetical protein MUC86_10955 [Burkholderiaceae bacterium]|nr:hypothetical protein [Burkholderiaceae bacterium]
MNVDSRSDPSATRAAPPARAQAAGAAGMGNDGAPSGDLGVVDRAARCAQVRAQIDNIDASVRAGGSVQQQDWLREQRRKLEDERYRLKC